METTNSQEGSDNTLSVEMQQMEKRITESITNHNQESMKKPHTRNYEGNVEANTG